MSVQKGYLSDYFQAVAAKRLSAVEINGLKSNQHEFNGIAKFKQIFGESKRSFNATFIYLGENEDDLLVSNGTLTWYDARDRHPTRSEYRLYYQTVDIFENVCENDLLLIAKINDENLLVVISEYGSTSENQLNWLFGLSSYTQQEDLTYKEISPSSTTQLNFIANSILEQLGIKTSTPVLEDKYIDCLKEKFPQGFPTTKKFSQFSRELFDPFDCTKDPDSALLTFMEQEEVLFRVFEEHLFKDRLEKGFDSINAFISVSLSVQNRRKSRAGHAFENHLETIFSAYKLQFDRNKITEMNFKPDFIFPGLIAYHNSNFPVSKLKMLAVKTSCKDRWRQVLSEAQRIKIKHLITLEPGISLSQTNQMKLSDLQLVVPNPIQSSYLPEQQSYLMSLSEFLVQVRSTQ